MRWSQLLVSKQEGNSHTQCHKINASLTPTANKNWQQEKCNGLNRLYVRCCDYGKSGPMRASWWHLHFGEMDGLASMDVIPMMMRTKPPETELLFIN